MRVPPRDNRPITEEVTELIASGVDMYFATRDAALVPESMVAMGIKVHEAGCSVTAYLPEALSGATLANLRDNGQVAITLSRPRDHLTVQIKGTFVSVRRSTEAEKELQAVFRAALVEQFASVCGIPRSLTRSIVWWPSLAVEVTVHAVYDQTPGPNAGEPLARAHS
jgi:hypothetical protein